MAATQTVTQHPLSCKSPALVTPQHGVVTLFGYGIRVNVERGHLSVEDGIAANRRKARFPRVGHGIRRLVVIGADGSVSLSALRWLADQNAAFVMLERDGSVLAVTGPVRPSDARLRRAQALAHQSAIALQIARDLVDRKLLAQEQLLREKLCDEGAAHRVAEMRRELPNCPSVDSLRPMEALAAKAYWAAWRRIPVQFPSRDLVRVPDHWRSFGFRVSPLTSSPRLAVNPPNAMLNYLYAILESEARLAVASLGLDPGLGVMHFDNPSRDSLASDVMEPIRPIVDAYVLDWITRTPLRREWFFERRDGNCRLMASLTHRLSSTAPTWAGAIAPVAEQIARTFSSSIPKRVRPRYSITRLTQNSRRVGRGLPPIQPIEAALRPESVCRTCGKITQGAPYCGTCSPVANRENLIRAAKAGRIAAQSDQAQKRRSETQRKHTTAIWRWKDSDLPAWLNREVYIRKIQPRLVRVNLSTLMSALDVSMPYAINIRKGRRVPHPRHWFMLARLVGVSGVS